MEQEHSQHLRDVRRIEHQTASFAPDNTFEQNGNGNGEVDFESLVKGNTNSPNPMASAASDPWDMDSWATGGDSSSQLVNNDVSTTRALLTAQGQTFPSLAITANNTGNGFPSISPSPAPASQPAMRSSAASSSRLNARPVPASTFDSAAFAAARPPSAPARQSVALSQPMSPSYSSVPTPPTFAPLQPTQSTFAPLQPTQSSMAPQRTMPGSSASGPNYSLSLSPQPLAARPSPQPSFSFTQPPQATFSPPIQPSQPLQPTMKPPPGWTSGLMQPTVVASTKPKLTANQGWDDFDPLK